MVSRDDLPLACAARRARRPRRPWLRIGIAAWLVIGCVAAAAWSGAGFWAIPLELAIVLLALGVLYALGACMLALWDRRYRHAAMEAAIAVVLVAAMLGIGVAPFVFEPEDACVTKGWC